MNLNVRHRVGKTVKIINYFSISILCLAYISCNSTNESQSQKKNRRGFISLAERISIEKKDGYSILRILNPWQGAENYSQAWVLVEEGRPVPPEENKLPVIHVPVKKIICMSTTHVAMIEALGEEETITGMSGTTYLFDERLRLRAAEGLIKEVGYEASLDKESIAKLNPDVVIAYGVGAESVAAAGKLSEMGIKVIFNADYLESEPLKKCEWIKLFGALYSKEAKADSIFSAETERYEEIKQKVISSAMKRQKVLLGLPFRDTWYISPGNSYMSNLVHDAGGDYIWKDTNSDNSLPLALEAVYLKALDADIWLNAGSATSLDEIAGLDPRLGTLKCFTGGNVFNNNLRMSPAGGNDYWESGSMHPSDILNDIAAILNPALFPEHELKFYRKLY